MTERKHAAEALKQAHDRLEERVKERTRELKERAAQLSRLSSEFTLTEQRERRRGSVPKQERQRGPPGVRDPQSLEERVATDGSEFDGNAFFLNVHVGLPFKLEG